MTFSPDAGTVRATTRSFPQDFGELDPEDGQSGRQTRDIKKLLLVIGLGALSWVATYIGMLELIESNLGSLPFVHKIIIGFSVAMLMTMIIWLLDQMFSPVGLATKLCYVAGYVFLTIISVGFGFGFYWKVLESRSESSRSAESAVTQVQASLHAASTRLEQLNATLVQLAAVSREKAELERTKGTSCPNSRPGDGPRRKMRDADASKFTFASDFVKGRVESVKTSIAALDGDLAKIGSADASTFDAKTGTRNAFMRALSRKLELTVTGFNAFRTDPQLKQLRADLNERANKSTFGDPKKGGFVCPDPQLQQALKGAVRAIDQLPELKKPEIAAVEGSEATLEAFRRLSATFYGLLSFKLPPSADELRELQQKAVQLVEPGRAPVALSQEGAGLSRRDYIPLAIAFFVDLCLFLVSIGRPVNRLHGLMPKMREAERGPVIEILSRFNDIHRDREVRESFELFRHVVFDLNGDYYVAVPLDAPQRMNPQQREDLRLEAQLLSNLFASFEKERIFTRTWLPTTSKIQKKLRKQGSKFADSEAFRVYRFRKGAWSEIILGAVMGAARRAEAERLRRADAERDQFGRWEPPFAPVVSQAAPPPTGPYDGSMGTAAQYSDATHEARSLERGRATTQEPEEDGGLVVFPGSRSNRSARTSKPQAGSFHGSEHGSMADSRFTGFGAYARSAKAELEQYDDTEDQVASAANNNTAPRPSSVVVVSDGGAARIAETFDDEASARHVERSTAEPSGMAENQPVPALRPEPTVDLVLKRETVTIPLAEATLDQSLPSLLARAAGATRISQCLSPPPLPFADVNAAAADTSTAVTGDVRRAEEVSETESESGDDAPSAATNWSETDVTFVRRFKPDAAE